MSFGAVAVPEYTGAYLPASSSLTAQFTFIDGLHARLSASSSVAVAEPSIVSVAASNVQAESSIAVESNVVSLAKVRADLKITASAKSLDPRFIWEAPTTGSENVDEIWGSTPDNVQPASAWGEPSFDDVVPANVWKKAS